MSLADSSSSRDRELASVLTAPTPRVLPRAVRQAALSQAAPLSFGIFGALFGGFGLIFVWIFFPRNIAQEWKLNAAETAQATGRILQTAGIVRHGECFTTGRKWQPGESVQVIYLRDQPSIARPIDARLSRTSMGSL